MSSKNPYYKAGGGDGILPEPLKILKDDAVKVLHSICTYMWKTHSGHRTGKGHFFFSIPKKGNAKECSNFNELFNYFVLLASKLKLSS